MQFYNFAVAVNSSQSLISINHVAYKCKHKTAMICFRYVTWTHFFWRIDGEQFAGHSWINFTFIPQFQGVSTIKKSYSLSDLSETDGTNDSFRQEMIVPTRHRPRPKAITTVGISTRSTSLTKRPTSELYFPEVEFKEPGRRSTGDYKWVEMYFLLFTC